MDYRFGVEEMVRHLQTSKTIVSSRLLKMRPPTMDSAIAILGCKDNAGKFFKSVTNQLDIGQRSERATEKSLGYKDIEEKVNISQTVSLVTGMSAKV